MYIHQKTYMCIHVRRLRTYMEQNCLELLLHKYIGITHVIYIAFLVAGALITAFVLWKNNLVKSVKSTYYRGSVLVWYYFHVKPFKLFCYIIML